MAEASRGVVAALLDAATRETRTACSAKSDEAAEVAAVIVQKLIAVRAAELGTVEPEQAIKRTCKGAHDISSQVVSE